MGLHNDISIFVKVVQCRSFSEAARILGIPISTASAKVSLLEQKLGITLIQRTTRKLQLTEAGLIYFQRCLNALNEIDIAENELADLKQEPQGTFRILTPTDIGHYLIIPIAQKFLEKYSKINIEFILINNIINIIEEEVDLSLHIGDLKDSSLIKKLFINAKAGLWASPLYLKNNKVINHPLDLKDHKFIKYSTTQCPKAIELTRNSEVHIIEPQGKIEVNDIESAKIFAQLNQGIAVLPSYLCETEFKKGELVNILPDWDWQSLPISFVYPAKKFIDLKVKLFIKFAEDAFKAMYT
ncbi:LysR family transcriptional regulator [Candidatus Paracaedibacter symbiosus]|uniref:LysR family transcriptional regulator n=1 Tax=Candidatus Paracaedibacter symbiosus TaxID=244582 RepID=UPI0005095751|nr:LysR family transcriptional regulator [Candidatus Paracaedibacter symbiosus]